MTNSDLKLISQIKNLRKLLHAQSDGVQIYDFLSALVRSVEKCIDESEVYNGLCLILDEILNYRYIVDNIVDNTILQFTIKKFTQHCELSNYAVWGIVFAKLYGRQYGFNHPIIFADIAYFASQHLSKKIGSSGWLNFDFDGTDLAEMLKILYNEFREILKKGSTFSLYLEEKPRNALVKYLYDKCAGSSKTNKIFFPLSKTFVEPIVIAYLLSLRCEAVNGKLPDNFAFYVGKTDAAFESKIQKVYSYYEEFFLKIKTAFAAQNNINIKSIKTNLKTIKKQIIEKSDKDLEKIRFDYAIINPFNCEILQAQCCCNCDKIIAEVDTDTCLTNLGLSWNNEIAVFSDRDSDKMHHLTECTKIEENVTAKPKQVQFDEIFTQRLSYSGQQMKMLLAKSNFIVSQENMLKYGELLYLAGQYSKSFDLIKQHYMIDPDYAYRLLNYITQNCKNNKLNQSINSFIIDRALDKEGFGQAMLEAIVDGVDDYFEDNPGSVLKDKHWL